MYVLHKVVFTQAYCVFQCHSVILTVIFPTNIWKQLGTIYFTEVQTAIIFNTKTDLFPFNLKEKKRLNCLNDVKQKIQIKDSSKSFFKKSQDLRYINKKRRYFYPTYLLRYVISLICLYLVYTPFSLGLGGGGGVGGWALSGLGNGVCQLT